LPSVKISWYTSGTWVDGLFSTYRENVEASTSSDQAGTSSTPTPAAPAAPESTDSGFQEGNAEAAPSPSSALPSDSSPDDVNKKSGTSS
jgi:hypothetical protein